jgi:allophanate hydrolase
MTIRLDIVDPGLAVAVQDRGRFGLRRFGVPVAGALDPTLLACANALLMNATDAAGLELLVGGPALTANGGSVAIALAGDVSAHRISPDGGASPIKPWTAVVIAAGETLRIAPPRKGIAYLAVSGGIQTEPMLGSRATYRRAGLGGFLEKGGSLPCAQAGALHQGKVWAWETGPIRLLPGPQDDHFPPESFEALERQGFRVGPASDRMGLRLWGKDPLKHTDKGAEIATDGVTPGVIQVPGDGQPIVLLADGQTTGGYAKIATVISADLPRLGHLRPGDAVDFKLVTRDEARKALRDRQTAFARWCAALTGAAGQIDQAALYRANLISGAISGQDE